MPNGLSNRQTPAISLAEITTIVLLATLLYLYLFGAHTLNPLNTAWMLHGDPAQHYLGWQFFRSEPWQWPPGRIQRFGLPDGTSLVFTDAIPLLALLIKPVSTWLPTEFQYFGLWMLSCFILNGYFGLRLLSRFTENRKLRLVAACFFIVSPPLLLRGYGHESLMAQWLILASMETYLSTWTWQRWLLWSALAALCHPYLLVMVMAVACASASVTLFIDRSHTVTSLIRQAAGISAVLIVLMGLAGYFSGPKQLAAEGYGFYSMNVLSLVDPLLGWSRFIRQRPIHPDYSVLGNFGQYEGFLYLGAGMLLLGCMALAVLLASPQSVKATRRWWPLIAVAALFWVLALSNRVMFSDTHLFTLPLPDVLFNALSVFRASGRFGWIAFYTLNLIILISIIRRLPAHSALAVLTVALALQIGDQSAKYKEFRQFIQQRTTWQTPLQSALWASFATKAKQLIIIPPHPPMQEIYLPFAQLASRYLLGTNAAHLAHNAAGETDTYGKETVSRLAEGRYNPETLYVFPRPEGLAFVPARLEPQLIVLDGFTVLPPGLDD